MIVFGLLVLLAVAGLAVAGIRARPRRSGRVWAGRPGRHHTGYLREYPRRR
jgi:hypothetical protein